MSFSMHKRPFDAFREPASKNLTSEGCNVKRAAVIPLLFQVWLIVHPSAPGVYRALQGWYSAAMCRGPRDGLSPETALSNVLSGQCMIHSHSGVLPVPGYWRLCRCQSSPASKNPGRCSRQSDRHPPGIFFVREDFLPSAAFMQ